MIGILPPLVSTSMIPCLLYRSYRLSLIVLSEETLSFCIDAFTTNGHLSMLRIADTNLAIFLQIRERVPDSTPDLLNEAYH
jgi:hypothetical protein